MQKMKQLLIVALMAGSMNTYSELPSSGDVILKALEECNASSNKNTLVPCLAQSAANALNDFSKSEEARKGTHVFLKDQQEIFKKQIKDLEKALTEAHEDDKQIIQDELDMLIKASQTFDASISILEQE